MAWASSTPARCSAPRKAGTERHGQQRHDAHAGLPGRRRSAVGCGQRRCGRPAARGGRALRHAAGRCAPPRGPGRAPGQRRGLRRHLRRPHPRGGAQQPAAALFGARASARAQELRRHAFDRAGLCRRAGLHPEFRRLEAAAHPCRLCRRHRHRRPASVQDAGAACAATTPRGQPRRQRGRDAVRRQRLARTQRHGLRPRDEPLRLGLLPGRDLPHRAGHHVRAGLHGNAGLA
jgi:hypothetical protein